METISKAIWGERHQTGAPAPGEPVSGVVGNTDSSDPTKPYDAGNDENAITKSTNITHPQPDATQGDELSVPPFISSHPNSAAPAPSAGDQPSSVTEDSSIKQNLQGADHPTEVPTNEEPTPAIQKKEPEEASPTPQPTGLPISEEPTAAIQGKEEEKASPTPQPTGLPTSEEPTAAIQGKEEKTEAIPPIESPTKPPTSEELPGILGDAEKAKGAPHPDQGTGAKYVRSTGMAADGGDFDATRPGAGQEADRLREEAAATAGPGSGPQADGPSPGHKTRVGEKIKSLMHPAHANGHGSVGEGVNENGEAKKGLGEKVKEKMRLGGKH
ncbi:MAG: hypothetical protein M1839_000354 [Geoglossum umbratile]|nr:MAG: hypothetical protein M1839_000354 [Geoglossum umbratile]